MKICPTCNNQYEANLTFCPEDNDVLEHDPQSLVNTTLDGQYLIEAVIGRGGMGTVYRARHILLGDMVAIKILPSHLSNDPEALRRFLREGQIARRFRHPNVVTVHDLRASEGNAYMVLEFIDGNTLRSELDRHGRFSPQEALNMLAPVANALNAAHVMGVVHRDLKLDNIMIGRSLEGASEIKLLDLGIAKLTEVGVTAMTQSGQLLGTPAYMSPEQWGTGTGDDGPKIDGRADIYSLGVCFFELIANRLPYDAVTIQELAVAHVLNPIPLLHEIFDDVPREFSMIIALAMAKRRADRPATCEELINLLQKSLVNAPTLRMNTRRLEVKLPPEVEVRIGQEVETTMSLFDYQVATVNSEGEVVDRRHGQAQFFIEELEPDLFLEMVWIPDGSFNMGSPDQELKRSKDESPYHNVSLSSFFIGKYAITQAQWRFVAQLPPLNIPLNPDPSSFKGDNLPVENVSWEDCQEFCLRLSSKTGRNYRLPSEAQWEYSCRAGTTSPFHFGETIIPDLANYNGLFRYGKGPKGVNRNQTVPVGSLKVANGFGLYDMHGNVWEWCQDIWHDSYEGAPNDGSVWFEGGDRSRRVMRGGSWYANSGICRSATRAGSGPTSHNDMIGFRVTASFSTLGHATSNTNRLTLHWLERFNNSIMG